MSSVCEVLRLEPFLARQNLILNETVITFSLK